MKTRCPIPTCQSERVQILPPTHPLPKKIAQVWGNEVVSPIAICKVCNTMWEPWPEGTPEDLVEREPCDNCAYRSTSAENQDPEKLENLIAMAEQAAQWNGDEQMTAVFQCHKGMPIRITTDPPSFCFDPKAAGIKPTDQWCLGFMRVVWAQNRAAERAGLRPKETP